MPDAFYRRVVQEELGKSLGPMDSFGAGIVFTPKNDASVEAIKDIFEAQAQQRNLKVIGWRSIATGSILLPNIYMILLFDIVSHGFVCLL